MSDNKKIIIDEFEAHKGEFVIDNSHKVTRFVGLVEDDMDYYYLLYNGREFHMDSCVGKLVFLKNKIDDEDYNEFIRLAKLNDYDYIIMKNEKTSVEEFRKRMEEELLVEQKSYTPFGSETNRLLVPIHWDFE